METQTWELTDEQYNELLAKSEELHTLCKKLQFRSAAHLHQHARAGIRIRYPDRYEGN